MGLHISSNLALGLAELKFLQENIGFKEILKAVSSKFGVVLKAEDTSGGYTDLKIVQGDGIAISIMEGAAIDGDLNVIKVPATSNVLEVPANAATRYVVIKYAEKTIEPAKVTIQADGTMTVDPGEDTSVPFTQRLRGLGVAPSKIRFPNSTKNTGEYFIRSVISETTALLNVGAGAIVPEQAAEWEVIGTFTAGTTIPEEDKRPFRRDSYFIELRTTAPAVADSYEFALASISYNGGALSITDLRSNQAFKISSNIIG